MKLFATLLLVFVTASAAPDTLARQAAGGIPRAHLHGSRRIVVLAEGMASLFLGQPGAVRLTGVPNDPSNTTYWGKDSGIFMEELLTWLIG